MAKTQLLADKINSEFSEYDIDANIAFDEITVEVPREHLLAICQKLRDHSDFKFECLMDVCGVDYLEYGIAEWATEEATATGFSRGVEKDLTHRETSHNEITWNKPRFAVVYNLLSVTYNQRIRLRTFPDEKSLKVDSVIELWPSADWFEREAFDLFGILFEGHPDLRRILTDYGFSGHPFRKDFPLIGNVEPRYDAAEGRIVYEPVSIEPRTLVPKVIRDDNRYVGDSNTTHAEDKN